jgi:tetratricopeptide (TPR) repeat protein
MSMPTYEVQPSRERSASPEARVARPAVGRPIPLMQQSLAVVVLAALVCGGCAPKRVIGSRSAMAPVQERPVLRLEANEAEAARLEVAGEAVEAEDYETALRVFRDLLNENPTLVDAYTGMAEVLEQTGDLELAESAYGRATRLDPTDFSAASGHGRVLEALGQLKQAVRAFQRALVIRPTDLDSNLAMARLMLATGQADAAVAFAERATRLDPSNGFAHLWLARAYSKVGRGKDAIREYETACELIEPPADVMMALVNAYAAEKRYQEAANAAEALIRTSPSAAAHERLGWSLFRLGEFAESDKAYRQSIELDAEYWPALNGVGVNALNAWIKAGKDPNDPLRDEARLMLQRSLRANPDQPKVAALLMKYRL